MLNIMGSTVVQKQKKTMLGSAIPPSPLITILAHGYNMVLYIALPI